MGKDEVIYVDEPQTWNKKFKGWCHMWSSQIDTNYFASLDELRDMARQLGLKDEHIQVTRGISGPFPHYDLHPSKRELALKLGAHEKKLIDWIADRLVRSQMLGDDK